MNSAGNFTVSYAGFPGFPGFPWWVGLRPGQFGF